MTDDREMSNSNGTGLYDCWECRKPIGADEERYTDFVAIPDGPGCFDASGQPSVTIHRARFCMSCWRGDEDEAARP
jgi:hypothetical protein